MKNATSILSFCAFLITLTVSAQDAILQNPSACGLNLPIADLTCPENTTFYNPNVFDIEVAGVAGTALGADVYLAEVRLLIEHPWISDLNVRLRSPGGQEVQLVQNIGGNGDSFGDTSLVDCSGYVTFQLAACQGVAEGIPPYNAGSYRALEDFYVFNDGLTSPNGTWVLLICDDLEEDSGFLQYVELVFTASSCPPVADVEILSQDTTSIQLELSPSLSCTQAVAEIGPPGFVPGTGEQPGEGEVFAITCPRFTLSELAADTEFELYVRRRCAGSNYTGNSCPLRFRTACEPPTTTSVARFSGASCVASCTADCPLDGDWQNISSDEMNWLAATGPTPTANTGPTAGIGGAGTYLYLEANGTQCANGASALLAGPCITLDQRGSDDCHWSFYYHMQGVHTGSLRAEVSADGGISWEQRWERTGPQGSSWQHAYVSLADYPDGSTLQLRLVGTKGDGIFGDIAVDDIRLHGSQSLGYPATFLYVDADGDGFGDAATALPACRATAPAGYALNGDDCDDANPDIYPGAPEGPCNGIDENCNAATVDDDSLLPPPLVRNDTICAGETAVLTALADPEYTVFWYDDSLRTNGIIGVDTLRLTNLPTNDTPFPIIRTYYAEVTNFVCSSAELVPASVLVYPNPAPVLADLPRLCPGDSYNLGALELADANFTGATTTFHTDWPTETANTLDSRDLTLTVDTTLYYQLRSPRGCTVADSFELKLRELPELTFSPADSFSLCRLSLDTVRAQVSGGAGDYTYLWENGLMQASLAVQGSSTAGEIQRTSLQVTDAAGCTVLDSVRITTTISIDSLRISAAAVSTCTGTDGSITIVPLNGLSPFAYQWEDDTGNTGQGMGFVDTVRIPNLPQNAYRVTVSDSSPSGCPVRLRNIRVQGPGFQLSDTEVESPSCAGASDGALRLDVSGNTGTLDFQWSDGQTTAAATGLGAGHYSVTISNGTCTTVESYELLEPDSIRLLPTAMPPSCPTASDGSLEVAIFGGTPTYAIEWSNGSSLLRRDDLSQGSYAITVTDQNACIYQDSLRLAAPAPLLLVVDTLRPVSCANAGDALVQLGADGGTPPYRFEWADGSTASFRFPLAAGNYPLTFTDGQGCSGLDTIRIAAPEPLDLMISSTIAPVCRGDLTGEIRLQAVGGTAPYLFTWTDGLVSSNPVRTDLGVGSYGVMVSDARGCKSSILTIELAPQSNLSLTATLTSPTCIGLTDGTISLSVDGQSPFDFEWSTGAQASTLTDLAAGNYGLTVTDARSCVIDTVLELTAPQVFVFNSRVVQPSCFGVNDGIIDQSFVETGTAPVQFFWNDNTQHVDQMFLAPGDYQFTVTDAVGCTFVSDTFELRYPEPLGLEVLEQGGIQCAGDTSGYFETRALGGTSPYLYTWLGTGRSGPSIYQLSAGPHRLLVTDERGCTVDTLLQLADPPVLEVNATLDVGNVCSTDDPDVLTAMAMGGRSPYRFQWNNNSQSPVLVDPIPGDYVLTVTDENDCASSFGTLKVQDKVPPLLLDSFRVEQVSCFAGTDAALTAFTNGGSGQLRYHFTPTYIEETGANSLRVSGINFDNNYSVTVTDLVTGCEVEAGPVAGVQPDPLRIERDSFLPVNCFGGRDGAVFVEVTGGTEPYGYRWTNDAGEVVGTMEDLRLVGADIYHLLATDANGCTSMYSDSNVVSLGGRIFVADTLITAVACRGEFTGSIDLSIDGGSPPYAYRWSTGAETEDIGGVRAGLYTLTVTDSDTCRVIFPPLRVPQPPTAIGVDPVRQLISCFGDSDGGIAVAVSGGGGPPYQYRWRRNGVLLPSLTGPVISSLDAAAYELAVTDTNACTQSFLLPLAEPDVLTVEIDNVPTGADSLIATVGGGTMPYSLRWSTGDTTQVLRGLASGDYSLMVTDANDCAATASFLLTAAQQLSAGEIAVALYPNPVRERLYLQRLLGTPSQSEMEWQILDAQGRSLALGRWKASLTQIEIETATWPAGLYLLRLWKTGRPFHVQPFLIVK